ncbi:hypothetical protein P0Y67_11690 [Photobacterium sp. SP02]|uniref:hypothetical protein n=1 Tax=Photobacterium sp. SP02 TaxID=3032280 RepID=UPI0031454F17
MIGNHSPVFSLGFLFATPKPSPMVVVIIGSLIKAFTLFSFPCTRKAQKPYQADKAFVL